MRVVCAVFLLWFVAGCAPFVARPGPPQSAPVLAKSHIRTADGAILPLRHWPAKGVAKGVIIGLHGFNDYSKSFAAPADVWTREGLTVYAYDQRGFGAAPDHGLWPGVATLTADLNTAVTLIRQKHPDLPLFLVGESMGGAVVLAAAAGATPPDADGLVLSAPAVWARHTMPAYQRAALWFAAHTVPWLKLTGRGLKIQASDNIEMLRELGRDPLVIKGTRVDALYGLSNLMDAAHAAAPRLRNRTLILFGRDEQLIPEPARRTFLAGLPDDGSWRYAEYPTGFHMLLRDLNASAVLKDIAAWTSGRDLPSGADKAKSVQRWALSPCNTVNLGSAKTARSGNKC